MAGVPGRGMGICPMGRSKHRCTGAGSSLCLTSGVVLVAMSSYWVDLSVDGKERHHGDRSRSALLFLLRRSMVLSADWPGKTVFCLLALHAARRLRVGWSRLRRLNCVEGYVSKTLATSMSRARISSTPEHGKPFRFVVLGIKDGSRRSVRRCPGVHPCTFRRRREHCRALCRKATVEGAIKKGLFAWSRTKCE